MNALNISSGSDNHLINRFNCLNNRSVPWLLKRIFTDEASRKFCVCVNIHASQSRTGIVLFTCVPLQDCVGEAPTRLIVRSDVS